MILKCAWPACAKAENGCSATRLAPAAVAARKRRRVTRFLWLRTGIGRSSSSRLRARLTVRARAVRPRMGPMIGDHTECDRIAIPCRRGRGRLISADEVHMSRTVEEDRARMAVTKDDVLEAL